jgi:hypothetical protein
MRFTPAEMKKRADEFNTGMFVFFVYCFSFFLCAAISMVAGELMPKYTRAITYGVRSGFGIAAIVGIILFFYIRREEKIKERKEGTLLIGMVRCKKCNTSWEALTLESALMELECPICNACDSEPLNDGGKNEKKQKKSL